jgi:hypothetical protein
MSTCPNCSTKTEKEDATCNYGKGFIVHIYSCPKCNSKFRDYVRQKDGKLSFTLLQKNGKGRFKKPTSKD